MKPIKSKVPHLPKRGRIPCPCGKGFVTAEDQERADKYIESELRASAAGLLNALADSTHTSKTYEKVVEHRGKCPKWGNEFCMECFGGGLGKFVKDLCDERLEGIK